MPNTRRLFIKNSIVGLTAMTFRPLDAFSDCRSETKILGFSALFQNGTSTYSTGTKSRKLGDCELRDLIISLQGSRGFFEGKVCTHFTHTKDVWHLRLQFVTGSEAIASSQHVVFDRSWDGPQMSEQDDPLFHPWHETFPTDPAMDKGKIYARITSCC
jgi:hypothetical protein